MDILSISSQVHNFGSLFTTDTVKFISSFDCICKTVYINTSPAYPAYPAYPLLRPLRRQISVYKHFSRAGNVFLNIFKASLAPEKCI